MRDQSGNKTKTDTVTTGTTIVAGETTEDVGSTAARVATHPLGIAAVKHIINKRDASITSGFMKRTATTEELGRIGSARSSITARAEG
jgi:hypothetical protein